MDEKNVDFIKSAFRIEWRNVGPLILGHILSPYAIYLLFTEAYWKTWVFTYFMHMFSIVGITAGAHRLWSHRTYKAVLPLQALLLFLTTMTVQGSIIHWARDHRLHHKHADTSADPHNSKRGFFYSHIGWLCLKKSPEVIANGRLIDMSDLQSQPMLYFQDKYYTPLVFSFGFLLPGYIPTFWGEPFWTGLLIAGFLRLIMSLHIASLINSAAHTWGDKPYEKDIAPCEQKILSVLTYGEGFHNYHHTFPWDYRTGELGGYRYNFTWLFIDLMAKIGWAYDMKTVPEEFIEKRVMRTGDGSHPVWRSEDHGTNVLPSRTRTRNKGI